MRGRDGVMTQSWAILHQLALRFGRFGGASEAENDEILRWILWDNHKLTAFFATSRFMLNFMPEAKRDAGVLAFLNGRRVAAFKVLEARVVAEGIGSPEPTVRRSRISRPAATFSISMKSASRAPLGRRSIGG